MTARSATPPRPGGLRYAVVGTAGHIDHGKSALVRALTGIDPDRLEEEKRRGMTIDLGFAHFDLPSGLRVGLVDVPGHERLIKNMLAGAAGVDLVLLVIAADEGVMPQTREHLDILRFLQVRRGIVVLNKADLVGDPEWLALVREDVAALTAGTFLEGAPVVPVSARTGAGLADLVAVMDRALHELPLRDADAPARLPVDRSFTMAGFGTVVTGTLWTGRIRAGDVLELLPPGREVRVRQVQSHGVAVEEADAGQRVALNLAGVAKEEVVRGHVLASPGAFRPSQVLDVRLRLLPGAPALAHHGRIRLYVGADEVIGRVRLLDRDRLRPGDEAVAQVRLERPTVAARGDPFVLRRYSPMATIGGGEVVAASAPLRPRGADAAAALAAQAASGLGAQVLASLRAAGAQGAAAEALAQEIGVPRDRVVAEAQALVGAGQALEIRGRLFARDAAERIRAGVLRALAAYHAATPWRIGMPRDDLKSRVFAAGDDRLYGHVTEELAAEGQVVAQGEFVRSAAFVPARTAADEAAARAIEDAYRRGRFAPPGREEALAQAPDRSAAARMFQVLLDEGALVDVGQDVVFHRDVLAEIEARVVAHIAEHGELTVAALRDQLQSSRKYTLAVLEYFDARHLTRRIGDKRVLVRPVAKPP
jgi:selenocysteine-specific elongation factor